MSILTKATQGIAFGDVSNHSVRNILTEISKTILGKITKEQMDETLDEFDWKCPYTDKDLRPLIENKLDGYAADHIYPQNREWCGLNVKGNLIYVDKVANREKGSQDVETFLLNDTKVLGNLDMKTRKERLDKIKRFQEKCGYDPILVRDAVSQILKDKYDDVRKEQEKTIEECMEALKTAGINPVTQKPVVNRSSKSDATTDEFSEFVNYLNSVNFKSISDYKSFLRMIMEEMRISNVDELKLRIDEAIDYCEKEIEKAKKNKQGYKKHSNIRSACKKFKEYCKTNNVVHP